MFEIERDPIIHLTNEGLRRLGVKAVLFDLDDTLIYTSEMYIRHMDEYSNDLAKHLNIDSEIVFGLLDRFNGEEYLKNGANPENWTTVIRKVGEDLNCLELATSLRFHMDAVYTDEPEVIPGAKQVLSGLKDGNMLLGEVTWGKMGWTIRKNCQTGIENFMDVIIPANIYKTKNEEDWQKGMGVLGVTPEECLIGGDSFKGDILPALSLGARAIFITGNKNQIEVPSGVVTMKSMAGFYDAVQKLK